MSNPNGYYDRDRANRNYTTGNHGTPNSSTAAGTMNHPMTHHGNVAEYQASGIPFMQKVTLADNTMTTISFPYVTQWIQVYLDAGAKVQVGYDLNSFTHSGGEFQVSGAHGAALTGTNHIVLDSNNTVPGNGTLWRIKTDKISFFKVTGTTPSVYVIAGLTNVPSSDFPGLTGLIGTGSSTGVITTDDGS